MDPASEGFNDFRIKMTANNLGMKATDQKVDNLAAIPLSEYSRVTYVCFIPLHCCY